MSYLLRGLRLMTTPGLRRFVWLPLIINLLVFGLLGWLLYDTAVAWLDSFAWFDWLAANRWLAWLAALLKGVIAVLLFVLMGFAFTLLANLIGAPFNGLLAERVEAHLTGRRADPAPAILTMIRSLPRLLGSELAKIGYLLVYLLPLLLLQFIPVINVLAPPLLFLFGAWMFALEYLDYPMGNHGALFRDVRRQTRQHRGSALGFGAAVALVSSVPLLNLFVMPAAVAGATALYVDRWRGMDSPT